MLWNSLSDRELLSVLIMEKSTVINDLLNKFGSLSKILYNASKDELMEIRGVGNKKAQQILSIREVMRRLDANLWANKKFKVSCIKDITPFLKEMRYLEQEEFRTIMLDTKNCIIDIDVISRGTLNSMLVHPREVFCMAIRKKCASIILVHNHPSGDTDPSVKDIQMTERLVQTGEIIGIKVLDHIIMGNGYYSFKERGMLRDDDEEMYRK